VKFSKASGSMSERARANIDEFFIKHPHYARGCVWIGISAEVCGKAFAGAQIGATFAGVLLNAIADQSTKMSPRELEKLISESVSFGTAAGVVAGMSAAAAASTVMMEVPAAGIWGYLGYTTMVAGFGAGSLAAVGGAVALPVAAAAAAAYGIANGNRKRPQGTQPQDMGVIRAERLARGNAAREDEPRERRRANDGHWYTWGEFVRHYGAQRAESRWAWARRA